MICLYSLYQAARKDKDGLALDGNSPVGRHFGSEVVSLCSQIAAEQGFYAWGQFDANGLWRTAYVGKAGFGKVNMLRERICKELKTERIVFWGSGQSKRALGLYGAGGTATTDAIKDSQKRALQVENHFERALRKEGATHIVWVATPHLSNDDVNLVEPDLIETLNPAANIQRSAPTSGLQDMTVTVIREMKKQIHEMRLGEKVRV